MRQIIVLTDLEGDAMQFSVDRRQKALDEFKAFHAAVDARIADVMRAHGLPPVADGTNLVFSTKEGRRVIEFGDDEVAEAARATSRIALDISDPERGPEDFAILPSGLNGTAKADA